MINIYYNKFFETVIKGIPDLINVYDINCKLIYSNDDKFDQNSSCDIPEIFEAIRTKSKAVAKKYIACSNKFVEICYNPILNDLEEIVYIVERYKDITESKVSDNNNLISQKKYQGIIETVCVPTIIVVKDIVVYASTGCIKAINLNLNEMVGKNIYSFIPKGVNKRSRHIFKYILKNKVKCASGDYQFENNKGEIETVEATVGYSIFNGQEAIRIEIRDITKLKSDLNRAAKLQRDNLQIDFPIKEKAYMKSLYIPFSSVSGDYFRIKKINDEIAIGVIWDVTGKGLSAALNVYTFDVIFIEILEKSKDLNTIVNLINIKLVEYFENNYISACCFSLDFSKNELSVVGAGINQFIIKKKESELKIVEIEGTPLGMFLDSKFEQRNFQIEKGDQIYFYTDGVEYLLDNDIKINKAINEMTVERYIDRLKEYIDEIEIYHQIVTDDCTLVGIEIK